MMRQWAGLLICVFWMAGGSAASAQRSEQQVSLDADGLTLMTVLQSTLDNHPVLHLQEQQVTIERAVTQQATGGFDTVVASGVSQSRFNTPLTTAEQTAMVLNNPIRNQAANLTNYNFTASKLFRTGVTGGFLVETTRTADNVANDFGLNRSRLSFEINVPLLRGRGRDVVTAQESAAELEADAALFDLNQVIARLLGDSTSRYWIHVAAGRTLDVLESSESRGTTYVENVQALINADQIAPIEINQVQANLADRTTSRIAAQQRVVESEQGLALAMGLAAAQMAELPEPLDALPKVEEQTAVDTRVRAIESFMERALERRADILAAKTRQDSVRILSGAAENLTRPQLDLTFASGYSGLKEGRRIDRWVSAVVSGVRGVDAVAGIRYEFPPSNNFAKGRQAEAIAEVRQADLRYQETARNVTSEVSAALQAVHFAISRVRKARESVNFSQTALEGEQEKLRLGLGSLVDLLTVEDRLTNSLLNLVDAELAYALALTRLRFASGTIVAPDQAVQTVDQTIFYELPF
jgi:outer membrane protein TolC